MQVVKNREGVLRDRKVLEKRKNKRKKTTNMSSALPIVRTSEDVMSMYFGENKALLVLDTAR